MRKELITEGELRSHLREQGIDDLSEVKEAYMEGDGHISVIGKQSLHDETPRRQNTAERKNSL